jgi:hypothetical protein
MGVLSRPRKKGKKFFDGKTEVDKRSLPNFAGSVASFWENEGWPQSATPTSLVFANVANDITECVFRYLDPRRIVSEV